MTSFVDLSGLERLTARVRNLGRLDATPLMITFCRVIEEDNRKGVLAGLDKHGNRMPDVTYRPVGKAKRPTAQQKNNVKGRRGAFSGFGPLASGLHGNLTTAEYRRLGGPPLAPRGAFSRVIANLRTAYEQEGPGRWLAYGAWFEVVSTKGRPFLSAHFEGKGQKRRDLTGVRPAGQEKARKAAVAWMRDQVRVAVGAA